MIFGACFSRPSGGGSHVTLVLHVVFIRHFLCVAFWVLVELFTWEVDKQNVLHVVGIVAAHSCFKKRKKIIGS